MTHAGSSSSNIGEFHEPSRAAAYFGTWKGSNVYCNGCVEASYGCKICKLPGGPIHTKNVRCCPFPVFENRMSMSFPNWDIPKGSLTKTGQNPLYVWYIYIYIWGNEHQFYQLFWCSGADSWRPLVGSCWVLKSAAWGLEAAEFGSLCGRWSEAASGGGALVHFTFW